MWKLKGYAVDAFDKTQVVYNIWANTKNDLPSTMTDIGYGTALGFGSTAQTFDDSKEWRWNGTDWVEQTDGQQIEISADDIVYDNTSSGMTATNVQDAIGEIKDTDDMQDRALAELYGEDANQQLEIDYAINTGSKNKLIITNQNNTLTVNGITFTKNDDQTITATGTATANADYPLNAEQPLEVGQSYTLSGCPNGGGVNNFLLRQLGGAIDYGDGATFTAESSSGNFYIRIRNGYAIQGSITFKPMLHYEEVSSNTFEPYAPTNRELYETTKPSYDFIFGLGTALNYNDDLNNYNKVGKIYAATGAIAATISNTPWTISGFMVITIPMLTATTFVQFLLPNTSGGKWYKRRYTTGAWGAWTEYDGTQVSAVQSVNSPMTLNLSRNDLNESLDSNFDLMDSIPEEEEGEEDD